MIKQKPDPDDYRKRERQEDTKGLSNRHKGAFRKTTLGLSGRHKGARMIKVRTSSLRSGESEDPLVLAPIFSASIADA
jgi:hypothetical protein